MKLDLASPARDKNTALSCNWVGRPDPVQTVLAWGLMVSPVFLDLVVFLGMANTRCHRINHRNTVKEWGISWR